MTRPVATPVVKAPKRAPIAGSWPPASFHPPCQCHHPWDEPCPTTFDERCGCRHGQPHRCGLTGIAKELVR